MEIILLHKHYDNTHLEEVKNIMETKGAPKIRAIWSDVYNAWLAVEGCHRIRAARELGLLPQIIDISSNKTVTYDTKWGKETAKVSILSEELNENAYRSEYIVFEEE